MNSRTQPLTIMLSVILVVTLAGLAPTLHAPTTNNMLAPKTSSVIPAVVDPASADFGINCSPTSLTYVQGGSGSSTCTVTSVNSFAGSVSITVLDDFHTLSVNGTSVLSSAKSLVANGTASFNLIVSGGTPFVYPVVVIGVGGATPISHSYILETIVNPVGGPNFPDYTVSLSASSISIAHGSSSNPTITLTSVNGWASSVNLGVSLSGSLLGSNAPTLSFVGGTTLSGVGTFLSQPSFTTTATATLSIATTSTTTLGVYIAIIQFNGGTSQPFVQHTAILTITVT